MKIGAMLAFSLALLAVGAPVSLAQTVSATTGAITGTVRDTSGGLLPGVTVTISSPAMQGIQTAVTNKEGSYRFPAVPPGDYKMAYELAGFATIVHEGVRISVGFTGTINIEMGVASVRETVTVSGQSPVIDVQSNKVDTSFDAQKLAALPISRDMSAIFGAAPSVQMAVLDVGGSQTGTQTPYTAYGTTGQTRPMVEGMVTTEGTYGLGFYYDYGSFAEVAVGTAAQSTETGTPGVMTQFISKSGGNAYHGTMYADYETHSMEWHNISADQIARGLRGGGGVAPNELNRLDKYHDVNADIGGFLKKDKLWWYFSGRDQRIDQRFPNFAFGPQATNLNTLAGKVTYAPSLKDKLIFYAQYGLKHQPDNFAWPLVGSSAIFSTPDSTQDQRYWMGVWKGEWNRVLSDRMFLEVRAGRFAGGGNWTGKGSEPRKEDFVTQQVSGTAFTFRGYRSRDQVLGSLSLFKDHLAGSHNIKFGGEVFREFSNSFMLQGYPGDALNAFVFGNPFEVFLFDSPANSYCGLWTYSAYVTDTWRMGSHVTVNLGLRFDRYREFMPAQTHPVGRFNPTPINFPAVDDVISWNLPAPRVGATFDLAGNGKTVFKVSYGQYWWNPSADLLLKVNPNQFFWMHEYAWTDLNGDGVWENGEQGQLRGSAGGVGAQTIDPSMKDTYTREVTAWAERELMPNFAVRAGFVWHGDRQIFQTLNANQPFSAFNVPVQVHDPGPDGVVGTSDDGPVVTAYNLDPSRLGLPSVSVTQTVPGAYNDFYTFELSANRRFTNRWSLMAGFSETWNRPSADRANPNNLINTDDGQNRYTTWTFKLNGTYVAPWGVTISPMLRAQSGTPFGRTFKTTLNYGSATILAEPVGAERMNNVMSFDVRIEKGFRVAGRRLAVFLSGFNVFNANPAQNLITVSGTSYLLPNAILPPRVMRVGAKFEW